MDIINAIILGIIQGLTEFLPVSSSGHLEITKAVLGERSIQNKSMLMTVVLHFATALSTIVIFRKDVLELLKGLFEFKKNDFFYFSVKILFSMFPAVLIGILFSSEIEGLFGGQIAFVGGLLILTGLLLLR